MCIAIYKKPSAVIDEETLFQCYLNNRDGCGIAFINEQGKLEVQKRMGFDEFLKIYKESLARCPESPFLIHFRVATVGEVNLFNCHPFVIDEDHVFMHNGSISNAPKCTNTGQEKRSDTQMFNDTILKNLPAGWMWNEAITELITEYISTASKIVAMDSKGNVRIYNERLGHWKDDIWYSNKSYESSFTRARYVPKKYDYYESMDWDYDTNSWRKPTTPTHIKLRIKYIDNVRHRWDYAQNRWRPCNHNDQFVDTPDQAKIIQLPYNTHEEKLKCQICDTEAFISMTRVVEITEDKNYWETLCCLECVRGFHDMRLFNYKVVGGTHKEKRALVSGKV